MATHLHSPSCWGWRPFLHGQWNVCRVHGLVVADAGAGHGGPSGIGTLQQGYLENSNVDVVEEFVQMVLAQRAYESNSKVIRVADDMYGQINNVIR